MQNSAVQFYFRGNQVPMASSGKPTHLVVLYQDIIFFTDFLEKLWWHNKLTGPYK